MTPRVWIVDDSPLDVQRAQAVLSPYAMIEAFRDGSEALERISAGALPDVLVLDWVMPGISGVEVVKFLRTQGGSIAKLPVLLLTAQNQPEQIAEGLNAGANDYVAKPYAGQELRARVEALARSAQLLARAEGAEQRLRELITNAPDALVSVDPEGRLTYANAEAARVFAKAEAAAVDQAIDGIFKALPRPFVPCTLADIRLGDRVFSPSVSVLPGGSTDTMIALRDVTEQRKAEERRLDFYSIVAHDLRSPLSAMKLRTHGLLKGRRGVLQPETASEIRKIESSLGAMGAIIDDFLDIAQLQGTARALDRTELPLASLIESTVDELRPLAEAGRLSLEFRTPNVDGRVMGDKSRLRQVLSNLLGNAIKFTPPSGRIEVRVNERGDQLETQITDNGPGIAPDAVPQLFDCFTRSGTPSMTVGWGLGLMIVREIVEAHGGRVGVNSEQGSGSTFWFLLPRAA